MWHPSDRLFKVAADQPATGMPSEEDLLPCPYCGHPSYAALPETGRTQRAECVQCGGVVYAVPGGQWQPELIGDPANHPSPHADPASGGVGGAANATVMEARPVKQMNDADHTAMVYRGSFDDYEIRSFTGPRSLKPVRDSLKAQGISDDHPIHGVLGHGDATHVAFHAPTGQVAGAIAHYTYKSPGAREQYINQLRTLRDHRGHGVGEQLVRAVAQDTLNHHKSHEYEMKVGGSLDSAMPFYSKLGADFQPHYHNGHWSPEKVQQLAHGEDPEPGRYWTAHSNPDTQEWEIHVHHPDGSHTVQNPTQSMSGYGNIVDAPESGQHTAGYDEFGETQHHTASWDDDEDEGEECEHCGHPLENPDHGEVHEDWRREQPWHTDWEDVEHIGGEKNELHRGMAMSLPPHVHNVVHDEERPMHERAQALTDHIIQSDKGHLGRFWSDEQGVSRHYATVTRVHRSDQHNDRGLKTPVVIHAEVPSREHIETDPDELTHHTVYSYHLPSNREVPLQHGTPMTLKGVSWSHPRDEYDSTSSPHPNSWDEYPDKGTDDHLWSRHDFQGGIKATSSHVVAAHDLNELMTQFGYDHTTGKQLSDREDTTTPTRRLGFAGYIEGEKMTHSNHGYDLGPDWEDEQPTGSNGAVHYFHRLSGRENNYEAWNKHGEVQDVPLHEGNVYATQGIVRDHGVAQYLKDPQQKWKNILGHPGYPGNDHPLFVKHQGDYYTMDGHHRTAAAMVRGDSHVTGMVYDADKHGIPQSSSDVHTYYDRNGTLNKYSALGKCPFTFDNDRDAEDHEIRHHDDGICLARSGMSFTGSFDAWMHTAMPSRKHTPPGGLTFDRYDPKPTDSYFHGELEKILPGWSHHLMRSWMPGGYVDGADKHQSGSIMYSKSPVAHEPPTVAVHRMNVNEDERGQGIASAMQDELHRQHPDHVIDHGDRSDAGMGWWKQYQTPEDHPNAELSEGDRLLGRIDPDPAVDDVWRERHAVRSWQSHTSALNDEVPWCAHLYHGNCTYPGDKLPNGTILGIPQDRGPCPWKKSSFQQAACPISAPGPMAIMSLSALQASAKRGDFTDYTVSHVEPSEDNLHQHVLVLHHPDESATDLYGPEDQFHHYAGHIKWDADGIHKGLINEVNIKPSHQRKGLATKLLQTAQAMDQDVHHGDLMTPDGAGWVASQKGSAHDEQGSQRAGSLGTPGAVASEALLSRSGQRDQQGAEATGRVAHAGLNEDSGLSRLGMPLLRGDENRRGLEDKLAQHYGLFGQTPHQSLTPGDRNLLNLVHAHHEEHGVPRLIDNLGTPPRAQAHVAAQLAMDARDTQGGSKVPSMSIEHIAGNEKKIRTGSGFIKADYDPNFHHIRVDPHTFALTKFRGGEERGWHPPRGHSTELNQTISHEFGHARDLTMPQEQRSAMLQEVSHHIPGATAYQPGQDPAAWHRHNLEHVLNHVSLYGGKSHHEMIAELHAEHRHSLNPSMAAQVAGRHLEGRGDEYGGFSGRLGRRHHESYGGGIAMTAEEDESYRMSHQPPDSDFGAPFHALAGEDGKGGLFPADVYTHPQYYDMGHADYHSVHNQIRKAQGNPEKKIRIYRALPAAAVHHGFQSGNWVSTSKEYARDHGRNSDPHHDWPVISATVPAKHLHSEGDLMEWGYNGPPKTEYNNVSFKGGHHQEVSAREDGSIRPVQRRENPLKGYSFQHYLNDADTDNAHHHVIAYDGNESYVGHLKQDTSGKTLESHVEPEHAHLPLEERMKKEVSKHRTAAKIQPELHWHFTASWSDVRQKAKRLRAEGNVTITVASHDGIGGEVQGDHGLYETILNFVPGSSRVGAWNCGCEWATYAFDRSPAFKRFESRMCSHALAMNYEAQSQGMFGKTVTPTKKRRAAVDYDFDGVYAEGHGLDLVHPPIYAIALNMVENQDEPADIVRRLASLGLDHRLAQDLTREALGLPVIAKDATPPADNPTHPQALQLTQDTRGHATDFGEGVPDWGVGKMEWCPQCGGIGCGHDGGTGQVIETGGITANPISDQNQDAGDAIREDGLNVSGAVQHEAVKDAEPVYLRFGSWPKDERSRNNVTGIPEEGVSVYDLDHHGNPMDPDPHYNRGHEHDEYCEPDCDLKSWNDDYSNDTREEMQGRVHRAERTRYNGNENSSDTGHLVKGHMVGIGHDGEPLLSNVRRVGDWIDHRHLFFPQAEKHRLAREPYDEDYEPPTGKHTASGVKQAPEYHDPTVAGVALKAADTGRVLMLQRGLDDEDDPAAGMWDFPGGHLEKGDKTSLHGGIREWEEEVGQRFPEGGTVHHTWTSPNGIYQGHLVVIPEEKQVILHGGRVMPNPDDPHGDMAEQAAWWDVAHAKKNPALRPEVKTGTPWGKLQSAGQDLQKAAADQQGDGPQSGEGFNGWRNRLWDGLQQGRTFNAETGHYYRTMSDGEMNAAHERGAFHPLLGEHLFITKDPDRLAGGAYGGKGGGHIIQIDPSRIDVHKTPSRYNQNLIEDATTHVPNSAVTRTWSWDPQHGDHMPSDALSHEAVFHEADYAANDPFSGVETQTPINPPQHSNTSDPASTGFATSVDPDGWDGEAPFGNRDDAPMAAYEATLHDTPEPALPSTDGELEPVHDEGQWGHLPNDIPHSPYTGDSDENEGEINSIEDSLQPNSVTASVDDIVTRFQRTAGGSSLGSGGSSAGPSDGDIAKAAREHLQKSALKDFTFSEQQELINEGLHEKRRARNMGDLKIEGTHYEALQDALDHEVDPDDIFV
jgi:GNAT superfamily N-acetyltransferase/8-oxo-dGTP pyrophosphatase MutT (NUDIX family)